MAKAAKKDNEDDMPESIDAAGHDEEDAPKKGKRGLIIIIAAVLLLGAGGAGLMLSGLLDGLLGKTEETAEAPAEGAGEHGEQAAEGTHGEAKKEVATPIVYYDLPNIVANLNPGSATPSFIKVTITIEAPGEEMVTKIQAIQPKIMDIINTYVRELRPSDLKGSAGVYRLRDELLLRVNKALFPDKINNILFKELLIQ